MTTVGSVAQSCPSPSLSGSPIREVDGSPDDHCFGTLDTEEWFSDSDSERFDFLSPLLLSESVTSTGDCHIEHSSLSEDWRQGVGVLYGKEKISRNADFTDGSVGGTSVNGAVQPDKIIPARSDGVDSKDAYETLPPGGDGRPDPRPIPESVDIECMGTDRGSVTQGSTPVAYGPVEHSESMPTSADRGSATRFFSRLFASWSSFSVMKAASQATAIWQDKFTVPPQVGTGFSIGSCSVDDVLVIHSLLDSVTTCVAYGKKVRANVDASARIDLAAPHGAGGQNEIRTTSQALAVEDFYAANDAKATASKGLDAATVSVVRDGVVQSASIGNKIAQSAATIAGLVGSTAVHVSTFASGISGGALGVANGILNTVQGAVDVRNAQRDVERASETLDRMRGVFDGGAVSLQQLDVIADGNREAWETKHAVKFATLQNDDVSGGETVKRVLNAVNELFEKEQNDAIVQARRAKSAAAVRLAYGVAATGIAVTMTVLMIVGTGGMALLALGIAAAIMGAVWLGYSAWRARATAATPAPPAWRKVEWQTIEHDVLQGRQQQPHALAALLTGYLDTAQAVQPNGESDEVNQASDAPSGSRTQPVSSRDMALRRAVTTRYLRAIGMPRERVRALRYLMSVKGNDERVSAVILQFLMAHSNDLRSKAK